MLTQIRRLVARCVAALFLVISGTAIASGEWQQIDASTPFVDRNGVPRAPSCSGGPVPGAPLPGVADTRYSFFVRPGNPKKLAIVFDGGGACWDPNTCVATALAGAPIYGQTVNETTAALSVMNGLGDSDNPENPIADYTQVFIPYCTGDLHTGARDTEYAYTLPNGFPLNWTIHHRGADNVAAVLDWLHDYYANSNRRAPKKVFLAGASAGGYGVLYHYPQIAALLPRNAKVQVMVDAANGIINQDFYDRALTPGGVWGSWDNLASQLTHAFASGPDQLAVEIFRSLGAYYPLTRFGQYTTAFDATQIAFYNIARHVDTPELWLDATELASAGIEWTIRARVNMVLSALLTWNYRYYLAAGTDHTILVSDKLYLETSARHVAFIDWLNDMVNRSSIRRSDWRNVGCTPRCQ